MRSSDVLIAPWLLQILFISLLLFAVSRLSLGRMEAVAKYCDEHVCVSVCLSVCLSASISPEPHARSLPVFSVPVAYSRGSVLLLQGDEIP